MPYIKMSPERYAAICHELILKGWYPTGRMCFSRNGKEYDLSAADLDQLDRIEREGHFLIGG